ncbi:hypothetical protein [Micromonospora sp. HUAS LYJ1]|uniref:hypothetical protein n=1 Tax=Micromonospora sp. HUAS LYJ1 TaxID=3061626 RepID=UPI0026741E49|nr:hypothetical protein [Micromonospora sp. HUAS LYJ1]WKU05081.1 hypothetical protein Q2K16_30720 [Micromonospora sp. HUAS LYJ1]
MTWAGSPATRGQRLFRRLVRGRAPGALAVTALSSGGNLLLAVTVARTESIAGVGRFALAFSFYVVVSGLARAVVTDTVLAIRADSVVLRDGGGRAVAVGAGAGLAVLMTGVLTGSPYLMTVGLALPGLVLYDYTKALAIGIGSPRRAAVQETVWGLVTAAVALLGLAGLLPAPLVFSVWAGTGALLGHLTARRRGYRGRPRWGLDRAGSRLAVTFGVQYVVTTGSAQLAVTALAFTAGSAVVGAISAGRTVFGPVNLLLGAATSLMIPYLGRYRDEPGPVRLRAAVRLTALVTGVAAPVALAVPALPDRWGTTALGANWVAARPLLLALAVEYLLVVVATVGFAGHRVEQAGGRALRIGAVLGTVRIPSIVVGAGLFGAGGAVVAMAAVALCSALTWWRSYSLILRRPRVAHRQVAQPAVGGEVEAASAQGAGERTVQVVGGGTGRELGKRHEERAGLHARPGT